MKYNELINEIFNMIQKYHPKCDDKLFAVELANILTENDDDDNDFIALGICPACYSEGHLVNMGTESEIHIKCLNCGEGFIIVT